MPRKTLTGLLLLMFLLTMGMPATAAEAGVELSLAQAKEIALQDNPEITLSQTAIGKGRVAISEARDAAKKMGDPTTYDMLKLEYVVPRMAEMELRVAEVRAEFTQKLVLLTVETAYYDVLRSQAEVGNKEKSRERALEQLRLAEASFAAGTVAKSDVMAARVGVIGAEVELTTAENNLDKAMMNLAQALGRDLTEQYSLTDTFDYSSPEELDWDHYMAQLLEQDLGVISAQEGLAVAAVQFKQAANIYAPHVFAYRQARYDRDRAQIQYDQARTALELNARGAYLNLKAADKAYALLAENVKYAEETARLAALRYEAGIATQLEMEKAFDQLRETEAQRLSVLYNYNLAKTQLAYGIFAGGGMSGAGF